MKNTSTSTLKMRSILAIALALTALAMTGCPTDGGDATPKTLVWRAVTVSKITDSIKGIAYGSGKFVAVGANGKMAIGTFE